MIQVGFLPFIRLVRPLLGTPIMDLIGGQIARDSSNYIRYAFSLGPRGWSIAYLDAMLALAMLLFLYDIRLPEDAGKREPSGEGRPNDKHWGRRRKDEYQLVEYFLSEREGPMVELKARVL